MTYGNENELLTVGVLLFLLPGPHVPRGHSTIPTQHRSGFEQDSGW